MTKVTIKSNASTYAGIRSLMKSGKLALMLEPAADAILEQASTDPNEEYVKTLRKRMFVSSGPRGRVSWQVGAAPIIGARVEAKRGTLARALARVGL
jgi:hypothetical protein